MTALSEEAVKAKLRLAASQHVAPDGKPDIILWRNNVGVATDPVTGRPVRFGLANESPQMNRLTKSSDFIGIQRVVITPDMVGKTVGVFVARETKASGFKGPKTARERAQAHYIDIVLSYGGDARFTAGEGGF